MLSVKMGACTARCVASRSYLVTYPDLLGNPVIIPRCLAGPPGAPRCSSSIDPDISCALR